jgi:chromatin segregation and condensation protein Rec8/ScpA/Scc1 (kleisin family)
MKAAQTQAIQKIQDPNTKKAATKSMSGQTLTPDEEKTLVSAAVGFPMQTEASDEELVKRMRLQRIPYKVYQELVKKHDRLSANKSKDPNILKQLKDLEGILSGDVKWSSNTATNESRRSLRRALRESEIQQAQVVLAAQDMVDNVQKMIEQATSMQYKDLPALVSQVRNEMGIDQAGQFKTDASAALSQLVQSLEESRQQLEEALGVVTGQEPLGGDMGDDMGGGLPDMDDDLGGEDDFDFDADLGDDSDIDTDLDIDVDSDEVPVGNLGRNRI